MEEETNRLYEVFMRSGSFKPEGYDLIGAAMDVNNEMRLGFSEAVYQESLGIELNNRNIPFHLQPNLPVYYKGQLLKSFYVPDMIVYNGIIVELETVKRLIGANTPKLINYSRISRLSVGYLIKFGKPK